MPEIISRLDARAAGLKRYFTGKPCINGHVSERYVADWICAECKDTREYAWRVQNRKRKVAVAAAWREKNHQHAKAQRRDWYSRNKDCLAEYYKAYNKAHPEYRKAQKSARRARALQSEGRYSRQDVERLFKLQKGKCAHSWCKVSIKRGYHIDHVIPLSRGGSNWPTNLQLLCKPCNLGKNDTHPIEYAQRHGVLL